MRRNYVGRDVSAAPEISICIVSTDGARGPAAVPGLGVRPSAGGAVRGAGARQRLRGRQRRRPSGERFGDSVELIALDRRRGQGRERLGADGAQPRALAAAAERGLRADRRRGRTRCAPRSRPRRARASRARASSIRRACSSRPPGGFPGVLSALAGALFLHRRLTVQSTGDEVREVGWVQSAGMMVRREAYEQVGAMDPDFFVYSDEVDWQRRARDAGWSVLYVPDATDRAPRAALARRGRAPPDRRVLAQPRPLHAQAPRRRRRPRWCAC